MAWETKRVRVKYGDEARIDELNRELAAGGWEPFAVVTCGLAGLAGEAVWLRRQTDG